MVIPKIIHQIWIQGYDNIPDHLKKYHQECKKINHNFKFIVWDDNKIRDFLKKNYKKKFLTQYDSYTIPAQKADFARYTILYKCGGIYLDMDMICIKNLAPFLKHNVFFTTHKDIFYKVYKRYLNGIVGSIPNHSLFPIIFNNIFIRRNFSFNVTYSTGTRLFYNSVKEYKKRYNKDDVKLIDSKYLHPCSIFTDEVACSKTCKNCYVSHTSNSSWSPRLKLFVFLKKNIKMVLVFVIILLIFLWNKFMRSRIFNNL